MPPLPLLSTTGLKTVGVGKFEIVLDEELPVCSVILWNVLRDVPGVVKTILPLVTSETD